MGIKTGIYTIVPHSLEVSCATLGNTLPQGIVVDVEMTKTPPKPEQTWNVTETSPNSGSYIIIPTKEAVIDPSSLNNGGKLYVTTTQVPTTWVVKEVSGTGYYNIYSSDGTVFWTAPTALANQVTCVGKKNQDDQEWKFNPVAAA